MIEIRNAIIKSTTLSIEDHGCLSSFLQLDFGDQEQGFGGYMLYKDPRHGPNNAGQWIWRCCEVAGVTSWEKLVGRPIRAEYDVMDGLLKAIGHFIKDDWFRPAIDFAINSAPSYVSHVPGKTLKDLPDEEIPF